MRVIRALQGFISLVVISARYEWFTSSMNLQVIPKSMLGPRRSICAETGQTTRSCPSLAPACVCNLKKNLFCRLEPSLIVCIFLHLILNEYDRFVDPPGYTSTPCADPKPLREALGLFIFVMFLFASKILVNLAGCQETKGDTDIYPI